MMDAANDDYFAACVTLRNRPRLEQITVASHTHSMAALDDHWKRLLIRGHLDEPSTGSQNALATMAAALRTTPSS